MLIKNETQSAEMEAGSDERQCENDVFVAKDPDEVSHNSYDRSKQKIPKVSDEEAEAVLPAVPLLDLFRFATKSDVVLNVVGIVTAIGSAFAFPVMLVFFGDVANSFIGGGLDADTLKQIHCNASYANFSTGSNSTLVSRLWFDKNQ